MPSSVYYQTGSVYPNISVMSNVQVPTTAGIAAMGWFRRIAAGAGEANGFMFGFYSSSNQTEIAGNWGMDIATGSAGPFVRLRVTYWNTVTQSIASSTDWLFMVLQRASTSSVPQLRVFADDGPTFTKLADLQASFPGGVVPTWMGLNAYGNTAGVQCTGLRIFTGSTFTDAECRQQATYRFPPTHSTAALYDYWILETATQLTGSVTGIRLSGSVPILSASSAPVSILPAQRLRYVNTNSTAGGNGTTNATTGANRAYPSLATVQSTEPDTLLTTDQYLEVQCGGGADIQSSTLFFAKTTDDTRYVILKPFPGNEATVPFDNNRYNFSGSGFSVFNVRNMIIDGLQFNVSGSGDAVGQGAIAGTGSVLTIRNCHIIQRNGTGIRLTPASGSRTFIINNFVSASNIGINALTAQGEFITHSIYNNTAICGGGGGTQRAFFITFYGANATIRFKNNLGYNLVSSAFGREATPAVEDIVNNASNDNTAFANTVGGATLRNRTFTFRNLANGDYRLAGNDVGAQRLGANLSTDSSYAFSTDFDGQDRNRSLSWDIGADQVQIGYAAISSTTGKQFTISTSPNTGRQITIVT